MADQNTCENYPFWIPLLSVSFPWGDNLFVYQLQFSNPGFDRCHSHSGFARHRFHAQLSPLPQLQAKGARLSGREIIWQTPALGSFPSASSTILTFDF